MTLKKKINFVLSRLPVLSFTSLEFSPQINVFYKVKKEEDKRANFFWSL